jgi:hypothetical protein
MQGVSQKMTAHRTPRSGRILRFILAIWLLLLMNGAWAAEKINHPFAGITLIARTETQPRPLAMHVVIVDLKTPGLRCKGTPQSGRKDTLKETTLQFLTREKAQLAINAHFFMPWPAPKPDAGVVNLSGLAASEGNVYSPFIVSEPTSATLSFKDSPALNIDAQNRASIVHRDKKDPKGFSVREKVTLHNAVSGSGQVLTKGKNTARRGKWEEKPNPRTVIGLAPKDKLVLFLVDGRQPGVSEGMSLREVADLLRRDYGVTDAINLDGGGSTTLCIADPTPRVVNVPVGILDVPGTLRPVGSSLAVFAAPQ